MRPVLQRGQEGRAQEGRPSPAVTRPLTPPGPPVLAPSQDHVLLPRPFQSCPGHLGHEPPPPAPSHPASRERSLSLCWPLLFTGSWPSLGKAGHSRGQALHSPESSSTEPHTAESHSGPAPNPAVTSTSKLASCAAPRSQPPRPLLFLTIIAVPRTLSNNCAYVCTSTHTDTHTLYLQPSLLIYQLWSKVPGVSAIPTQVQATLKNSKFPFLTVFQKCDVLELLPLRTKCYWFPHTLGTGLCLHPYKTLEGSYRAHLTDEEKVSQRGLPEVTTWSRTEQGSVAV